MSLNIAVGQKAALLAVLSLGSLVIVAAVVRLLKVMQFDDSSDRTCKVSSAHLAIKTLIQTLNASHGQGTLPTSPRGVLLRSTQDFSVPPRQR